MKARISTSLVRCNDRQRGAILFMALIALVTLMLAAVALTRSVDTSTVIAGNIAFRQAATVSADGGVESAIAWMAKIQQDNIDRDAFTDATHPFNKTAAASGYYANVDPALSLTATSTWTDDASAKVLPSPDASGNSVRYIVQRMCRKTAGVNDQLLVEADCLFSDGKEDNDGHKDGDPLPSKGGKQPLNRVTVRVTGPRDTVSYIQAFIY
jgi:type IV pilus assembly protein PilX